MLENDYKLSDVAMLANEGYKDTAEEICGSYGKTLCYRCGGTGNVAMIKNDESEWEECSTEDIGYNDEPIIKECTSCWGNGYV